MSLQYITDDQGKTTGVFIPIQEWNNLKSRYKNLEIEDVEVPERHKEVVRKRMEDYKKSPDQGTDFDLALDEIEKDL